MTQMCTRVLLRIVVYLHFTGIWEVVGMFGDFGGTGMRSFPDFESPGLPPQKPDPPMKGLVELARMYPGEKAMGANLSKPMCGEGEVAVPMAGHHKKITVNGCGPHSVPLQEAFGLTKCCNSHDVCYSTCGTSHEWCELEYKRCMDKVCKKPKIGTEKLCKMQAESFTQFTAQIDWDHELNQRQSCTCMPKEIAGDMHHEFLLEFLTEHDPQIATEEAAEELLNKWEGREGQLYASLVKKHGHKFVEFKGVVAEFGKVHHHDYKEHNEL
mmetsp:Transcript_1956/g.2143  ORF Transcript_1956/g.2143 Transcript_1956/m.2143 type:complete len:269 (-) Transcript_1956:31-837(-)